MSHSVLPDYNDPLLAQAVERLTPEQIHALPFGAIRLDQSGRVQFYSKAEARLSGRGDRPVLGFDFFRDIAPCMDVDNYRGRLDRALRDGKVDIEFNHIGDFEDRERDLQVRIQSAKGGGVWIFMRRG